MNYYEFYFKIGIILLIFLCVVLKANGVNKSECHSFYTKTKYYLGSKTPYRYVANMQLDFNYPGCTPKRIWSLVRHGTRNPGPGFIDNMRVKLTIAKEIIMLKHEKGKGQLCNKELSELSTWTPQIDTIDQKLLTHEGEDEMVDLAERFQLRFPDILPELYSNLTYKFRYTATQRTRKSAQYFATGLFGRYTARHVWYPEALHKDPVLRFYKLCEKWIYEVDKNPKSLKELEKFTKSPEALALTKRVSKRLGLDEVLPYKIYVMGITYNMNVMDTTWCHTENFAMIVFHQSSTIIAVVRKVSWDNDIHLMYLTCGFETAWTPDNVSPWCFLFTKQDLEVLEYAEDLKYYWIDGYGYKINYEQACPAIGDMIQHLVNTSLPKAVFYFTHSGTLLKVLSFLRLYQDKEPLTSDNFRTTSKDRKWRVSKIDVFGTNLAFILYRCGDEDKVLTLHQERPVTLPGCPENVLCPLRTILKLYDRSYHSCDFKEMCNYSSI